MFAKPLASLSSGLLARKGQARPAMRPQGIGDFGQPVPARQPIDDLGWNDMGDDGGAAARALPPVAASVAEPLPAPDLPPVLVARAALTDDVVRIAAAAVPVADPAIAEPSASADAPDPVGRVTASTGKVAFTLRLPADRHLRLRLSAAVTHRSAQAIVTEALDAFLSTLPEVEELARQCSPPHHQGPDRPTPALTGKRA